MPASVFEGGEVCTYTTSPRRLVATVVPIYSFPFSISPHAYGHHHRVFCRRLIFDADVRPERRGREELGIRRRKKILTKGGPDPYHNGVLFLPLLQP
jgi:hypothetical protein